MAHNKHNLTERIILRTSESNFGISGDQSNPSNLYCKTQLTERN